MEKTITMSKKEAERIPTLDRLIRREVKQKDVAKVLNLSTRQVRRVLVRYRKEGIAGLVHKNRGRISNRAINQAEKDKAIDLIRKRYHDFGPTFANEKLQGHGITIGVDTLRKEMIVQGVWKTRKKKARVHPMRDRRTNVGELIQLDGSPHDWFEGRSVPCTLIAFIDDATSRIMDGLFVEHESTFALFSATEHYLNTHGKPLSLYIDRHSTYKVNRQATIEEELRDTQEESQYQRAMGELGIVMIFAHSPQAKGRVERLFETLQDRLVKEMRLLGITGMAEGTRYVREVYIPEHNKRFAVEPKEQADLHRPLTEDLSWIFTKQTQRRVSKDLVVRYKNKQLQLTPKGQGYQLRNAKITVAEDSEGILTIRDKDKTIPHKTISVLPIKQVQVASAKTFTERQVHIPAPNHPWRTFRI